MAFYQNIQLCFVPSPYLLGDGICQNYGNYNTANCGFDNGDCTDFNRIYPECQVDHPILLQDGVCVGGEYNTEECGWDGGNCLDFNRLYSKCSGVEKPALVGNGVCNDGAYNSSDCQWDGGDCPNIFAEQPECVVFYEHWISDGICDGGEYNTPECDFDGGDCVAFNLKYPKCNAEFPSFVGDGMCDLFGAYRTEECGWDGGDCSIGNSSSPEVDEYLNCAGVDYQLFLGNGRCEGEYNTQECGFDGGDCKVFNTKHSDCFGVELFELGDGICQHNTLGCNYDDGDCLLFNALNPKCAADRPYLVGDGSCDEEYNTPECKFDGGDCSAEEEDQLPHIFFNGDLMSIERYRGYVRLYAIIQTVTSVISLLASIGFICMINRHYMKLSVPFHRLLFGRCVSDVILTVALSFSTLPSPKAFGLIWNAIGNKGSCQVQGFFIFMGTVAACFYSFSLSLYYNLIAGTYRRGWSADNFIRGKIEYFLHGVPVILSLIGSTTMLCLDAINPNMTYCFVANPQCEGIECDRSSSGISNVWLSIISASPFLICLLFVALGLIAIFFRLLVIKGEKQSRSKPFDATENNESPSFQNNDTTTETTARFGVVNHAREDPLEVLRNKIIMQRSRAIVTRVLSYSLAFFVAYLFPTIISIRNMGGLESGHVLNVLARVFFPLHGFFNFLVFIYPEVMHIKKRDGISFSRSFVKATQSRGRRPIETERRRRRLASMRNLSSRLHGIGTSYNRLGSVRMEGKEKSKGVSSLRLSNEPDCDDSVTDEKSQANFTAEISSDEIEIRML